MKQKMSQKASSQKLELLLADPLLVGAVLVFLRGHESAKGFAQTCLLFYRHLGDSSSQYTQAIWRQWIQQEFLLRDVGAKKCSKESTNSSLLQSKEDDASPLPGSSDPQKSKPLIPQEFSQREEMAKECSQECTNHEN